MVPKAPAWMGPSAVSHKRPSEPRGSPVRRLPAQSRMPCGDPHRSEPVDIEEYLTPLVGHFVDPAQMIVTSTPQDSEAD